MAKRKSKSKSKKEETPKEEPKAEETKAPETPAEPTPAPETAPNTPPTPAPDPPAQDDESSEDGDEGESKGKGKKLPPFDKISGPVKVMVPGGSFRVYSVETHGKDYKTLAKQFAENPKVKGWYAL